ncbi:UDP-N-acetylmuramoyl-L-alanyl-D-glutamate--2,6-diaminopimelate ligase [Candidatus Peregrinibacteria bacterium]|nr:UDP-N-acetylmuramoyl-L-alanyl-D-glutamate--2,6-diaminopimelate ligase [Candidatus Peregrinibacteria bacterium]
MLGFLRRLIPERHPVRLLYHKLKGFFAALYYGFPASRMIVVGITGTNGKTTTTTLVTNILTNAGYKVGMTSTIGYQVAEKKWVNDSKQTTTGPFELQKLLKQMLNEGCKYAIIEVTSHAIDQSRVFGINFDIAVITNVTADHIEYHGNFNNYLNAKGELFKKVSKGKRKFGVPKVFILNADDKYYDFFDQFVVDRKISYGLKSATVYAEQIDKKPEGSRFILHVPNNAIPVEIGMPGEFNIYNSLAAAATCLALQVPLDKIKEGLKKSSSIAGRFEHVDAGQKYSVIVDYAHTPESLENLFALYKKLTQGRLFGVFGATGGGRDKAKRPLMGAAANEYCDYIVLTNDDPYTEDEWQIINQIAEGIPRQEGKGFWKIPDRREAIRLALTLAREGDTVVVAGKGAEEVIMLRGKRVQWNDKHVIKSLIEREIEVEISDDEWEKRKNGSLDN